MNDISKFYSYGLKINFKAGYDKDLLLPVHPDQPDDFDPFQWVMGRFSSEDCFSYWDMSDSGIHIVFPDDILSCSFQELDEHEKAYNGVVCYPHMISKLKESYEQPEFNIPNL